MKTLRPVVVLDLDNTILVADENRSKLANFPHFDSMEVDYIVIRPFAIQFIMLLFRHFDIVLFTTGTTEYAVACCRTYLSRVAHVFSCVLARPHALKSNKQFSLFKHSEYIKNLLNLKSNRLIGIDDLAADNMDAEGYFKLYNVKPFYGAKSDRALKNLWKVMKQDLKLIR